VLTGSQLRPVPARLARVAGILLLIFVAASAAWLMTELSFNHEIVLGQRHSGGYVDGEENYEDKMIERFWLGVVVVCTVPLGVALTMARRPRLGILVPACIVCSFLLLLEGWGTLAVLQDWDPHATLLRLTILLSVVQLACLAGALALMARVISHPAVHRGRL
jgi:hypothetical protein